jgi:acyl-CoA thioester hydrolase
LYRAACKYLAPIRYDDVVTVHVRVTRVTPTRVEHTYIIERDGRTTSEASSTLACVGRNGRPQAMPRALWTEQPESRARAAD